MLSMPNRPKKKSDERDYFDRLAVAMEFVVIDPPDYVRGLMSGRARPDVERTIALAHDLAALPDADFARRYRVGKTVIRSIVGDARPPERTENTKRAKRTRTEDNA